MIEYCHKYDQYLLHDYHIALKNVKLLKIGIIILHTISKFDFFNFLRSSILDSIIFERFSIDISNKICLIHSSKVHAE